MNATLTLLPALVGTVRYSNRSLPVTIQRVIVFTETPTSAAASSFRSRPVVSTYSLTRFLVCVTRAIEEGVGDFQDASQ